MPARPESLGHLLRELAPQVLSSIVRRYRDFAAAEDAVQEALLAAATQWPDAGVPDNPRGWLIQVASRRIVDQVRAESARRHRETLVVSLVPMDEQIALAADDEHGGPPREDTLELLFLCCHPALSPTSAIALTLRAVGGLTTGEIARAFLVPEATMAQRISRAKQTLKETLQERPQETSQETSSPFAVPLTRADVDARLEAVAHVLYLIFNEGYLASGGDGGLVRVDLSSEAIRLTRGLLRAVPDAVEVAGLLSLMLLTDARRAARVGPLSELVPLDAQDRTRWDRDAIAEGVALITATLARGAVGPYQLQAAIAAVHDEAESADSTDWRQILALYGVLDQLSDNPMVKLNLAIATAMVHGPAAGLASLDALDGDARVRDHHRLDAVRAHLLERAGDHEQACALFRRAAQRTDSVAERDYLLLHAAQLSDAHERER